MPQSAAVMAEQAVEHFAATPPPDEEHEAGHQQADRGGDLRQGASPEHPPVVGGLERVQRADAHPRHAAHVAGRQRCRADSKHVVAAVQQAGRQVDEMRPLPAHLDRRAAFRHAGDLQPVEPERAAVVEERQVHRPRGGRRVGGRAVEHHAVPDRILLRPATVRGTTVGQRGRHPGALGLGRCALVRCQALHPIDHHRRRSRLRGATRQCECHHHRPPQPRAPPRRHRPPAHSRPIWLAS